MAYLKQTWKNLPNQTTPISADRLNHLETQYEESLNSVSNILEDFAPKSYVDEKISVSSGTGVLVSSFGSVGDGSESDSLALQQAIDSLPESGGVVYLDPGATHLITTPVKLRSNLIIEGGNATLIKSKDSDDHLTFTIRSEVGAKGYGAGAKNIVLRDFSIKGEYVTSGEFKEPTSNFHHVSDLTIENVTFSHGLVDGHYIDLLGCDQVHVKGCRFLGANPRTNREFLEAIQIDSSTLSGSSDKNETPSSFDGLPTKNVLIEGCYFGTLTEGSTTYKAPCAVGQHASALEGEAGWYENIQILNNQMHGEVGSTETWAGMVRLVGFRNVVISGNLFVWKESGTSNPRSVAISGHTAKQAIPSSQVGIPSPSKVTLNNARGLQNIVISNNVFIGFKDTDRSVIHLDLLDDKDRPLETPITISGNKVKTEGTSLFMRHLNNVHVYGNTFEGGAGYNVSSEGSHNVRVTGNSMKGATRGVNFNATDNGTIVDNFISDHTLVGIGVGTSFTEGNNRTYCWDISVHGNRVRSDPSSSPSYSILLRPGSRRAFFWGNRVRDGGQLLDEGQGTITSPNNVT